jgi:DHA1 family tetracycline resistance protein-like MFS transporter
MSNSLLAKLQGNARGCLLFEPLFLLPFSMYSTYATIYMYQLGIRETEIGWITSFGMIIQIVSSLISGYLTDRMGRKRALLYFDLLSWTVATLLWAVSQNVGFFVIAALVNGFQKIPNTAFYCLLVEDTPPQNRAAVFSVLQFVSVVGGLFAPLGGLLVSHYSLVTGVRIMYIIAFVCMTTQFIGRHYYTTETEIGLRKMRDARSIGVRDGLREYMGVIRGLFANGPLLLIFGVYILFNFQLMIKNTYLSIYLVNRLHVGDGMISLFPALASVVMLVMMWLLMPRIKQPYIHRTMVWGFIISILSNALLLITEEGNLTVLTLSTLLGAAGTIMTYPYLETAVANAIDDDNRANVFSVLTVLILIFTAPSGVIGGWTYRIDPRIPFVLVVCSFAIILLFMGCYARKVQRRDKNDKVS